MTKTLTLSKHAFICTVATAFFALSLLLAVMPAPARAAQLTNTQIQAILSLLSSFNVDSSTITGVSNILYGTNPTTPSPSPLPTVTSAPTFTASPTSGTAPLAVNFRANGLTAGASYSVNYGDGANSTIQAYAPPCYYGATSCPASGNATHTYTAAGTYTAQLLYQAATTCPAGALCMQMISAPQVIGKVLIKVTGGGTVSTLSISGKIEGQTYAIGGPLTVPVDYRNVNIGSWICVDITSDNTNFYAFPSGRVECDKTTSTDGSLLVQGSTMSNMPAGMYHARAELYYSPTGQWGGQFPLASTQSGNFYLSSSNISSITVTAPNGGEQWEEGVLNSITWAPYNYNPDINPSSDVMAYLERNDCKGATSDNCFTVLGSVVPSGKASIHWMTGFIDPGYYHSSAYVGSGQYGLVAPGQYYIEVVNRNTGARDRSDKPFTITPKKLDLKVNGSDGPITVSPSQSMSLSWSASPGLANCFLTGNISAPGFPISVGNVGTAMFAPNFNGQSQGVVTVACRPAPSTDTSDPHAIDASGNGSSVTDSVTIVSSGAPQPTPTIRVVSPNGGEQIDPTQPFSVNVSISGISTVSVALYKNDQWLFWIEKTVPAGSTDTHLVTWYTPAASIPGIGGEGSVYKIYVTGQRSDGQGYVDDKSDAPFGFAGGPSAACQVVDIYAQQVPGYIYSNLFMTVRGLPSGSGQVAITGADSYNYVTFSPQGFDSAGNVRLQASQTFNATAAWYILQRKGSIVPVSLGGTPISCQAIGAPQPSLISSASSGAVLGAETAKLTETQIQAVLNLLASFNVDQSTVSGVNAVLHGAGVNDQGTQLYLTTPTVPHSIPDSADTGNHPLPRPCTLPTQTLERGQYGTEVSKLQNFLASQGYLASSSVTAYFGPATEGALKYWQAAQGVVTSGDADSTGWGVFGPKTRSSMEGQCPIPGGIAGMPPGVASSTPQTNVPCPPPAPKPTAFCGGTWSHPPMPLHPTVAGSCVTIPWVCVPSGSRTESGIDDASSSTGTAFPAPTCTLTSSSAVAQPGEPVTLAWISTYATYSSGQNGNTGPSGSVTVTPTEDTVYQKTVYGPGGSATCEAAVSVNQSQDASGINPTPAEPPSSVQVMAEPNVNLASVAAAVAQLPFSIAINSLTDIFVQLGVGQ